MFRLTNQIAIMYFIIVALFFNTATSMHAFGGGGKNANGTLICTLQGYQWISFSDVDGSFEVDDSAPTSSQHCKICLFPTGNDSIDDYFIYSHTLPSFVNTRANTLFNELLSLVVQPLYFFAQGRAPPTLV